MRCVNCMRTLKDGGVCPYCGFDASSYKPPNDALPPGSALNDEKYVVGRVLGRGGFGITYVALDQNLRLRVAVKECLPQRDARRDGPGASVQWSVPVHEQETAMENFVREARKMAQIYGISGVVPVRGYFYDNQTAYIVMDYVDGETLLQRLRRTGAMSARDCFRLLSPVMKTLAQAHRRGLIHRDIKPNNIMLERTEDGEKVWLLDLGASKDLGTRDSAPNVSAESRIIGTPGYTPLEQCSPDGRIGPWTDVYAMSATFFYCVTGQKPPDSRSRFLETQTPEVLLSVRGLLGDVLRKGMALRGEERYQTMEELRDALEKALNDTPDTRDYEGETEVLVKDSPPGRKERTQPEERTREKSEKSAKSSRRKPVLVVLILLVILIPVAVVLSRRVTPAEIVDSDEPSVEIVASGECGENASWTLDADGLLTISGTGDMADYEYIEAEEAYTTPWFNDRDSVFNVQILSGITSIGKNALYKCSNLQSVKIPNSVTAIGADAFDRCVVLASVTIPNSVTKIGDGAFAYCLSLKSVDIPNSVKEIGEAIFYRCGSLTSVKIPTSVTEIREAAFMECSTLANVEIPNSVMTIEHSAFADCSALKSVTIPNSVTEIGVYAFSDCSSLESVFIPDSVTIIHEGAFFNCTKLASVSIPTNVAFRTFDGEYCELSYVFDETTTVTIR